MTKSFVYFTIMCYIILMRYIDRKIYFLTDIETKYNLISDLSKETIDKIISVLDMLYEDNNYKFQFIEIDNFVMDSYFINHTLSEIQVIIMINNNSKNYIRTNSRLILNYLFDNITTFDADSIS